MGTITLGLLIAIGLEQSVELVHRHYEGQEARHVLAEESEANAGITRENLGSVKKMQKILNKDVDLLVQHRVKEGAVPDELDYSWNLRAFKSGEWEAMRERGALGLVPEIELDKLVYMYRMYDRMDRVFDAFVKDLNVASSIAHRAGDKTFSATDTEALIAATHIAQGDLNTIEQELEIASLSGYMPASWEKEKRKETKSVPSAPESETK